MAPFGLASTNLGLETQKQNKPNQNKGFFFYHHYKNFWLETSEEGKQLELGLFCYDVLKPMIAIVDQENLSRKKDLYLLSLLTL